MATKQPTLVEKFLSALGNDQLLMLEADFLPILVLLDWLNYVDADGNIQNIYPLFVYKKGPTMKFCVSLTKYYRPAIIIFSSFLENEDSIKIIDQHYHDCALRINARYENYFQNMHLSEQAFLSGLQHAHADLQELVALTLFLDQLDRQVIRDVLVKKRLSVDLNKVWSISELQWFLSCDSDNTKKIIASLNDEQEQEKLQYIYTNYTFVPSLQEVKEKLKSVDVQKLQAELVKNVNVVEQNKKDKLERLMLLTAEEKKVLDFIDWSAFLRNDRKALINKLDVLIVDFARKLFEFWGVHSDLVPVSLVSEILQGKDYIVKNVEKIGSRKNKMALIYHGRDRYEEDVNQPEDSLRLLDAHLLHQNRGTDNESIIGETASRGCVIGKVRIILAKHEFEKMREGEILVTSMTRPEFVLLMKKSAAIITDEGGITSHAAIVARELNKPCIIGTKIATKVLHDGDEVEVDATMGVVRIIKRAS